VKKITGLYDVAIVTHPAYEQTTVGLREASEAIDKAIEEQLKRECGGKDEDKRDDDPDDHDDPDDKGETDEEREAREKAEREANGGETNAEKEEREARELEEMAQRAREQQIMRMRAKARRLNDEILSSLEY